MIIGLYDNAKSNRSVYVRLLRAIEKQGADPMSFHVSDMKSHNWLMQTHAHETALKLQTERGEREGAQKVHGPTIYKKNNDGNG